MSWGATSKMKRVARSRSWASWPTASISSLVKIRNPRHSIRFPKTEVRRRRSWSGLSAIPVIWSPPFAARFADLDRAVPIQESGAWNSQLALSYFPSQVATIALGIFGAFGLLLSIAGTFGLASYTVSKRLRELSIRVALGAQSPQILAAALGRMLVVLGSSAAIGLCSASPPAAYFRRSSIKPQRTILS